MRKICLLLIPLLLLTGAQAVLGAPAPPANHGLARLGETLNLTDEQSARIRAIHEEAALKARQVMADASLSPAEKRSRLQEIRALAEEKTLTVLTPEQRQQLAMLRAEAREKRAREERRQFLAHLSRELNLSEEQRTKIAGIYKQEASQIKALLDDDSLAPGAKKDKARLIKNEAREAVYQVLTPEQRRKYLAVLDELRQDQRRRDKAANDRRRFKELSMYLRLTPEQATAIQAIRTDAIRQIRAIIADHSLSPEARRSRIETVKKAAMIRVEGLLTPEQRQKLVELALMRLI